MRTILAAVLVVLAVSGCEKNITTTNVTNVPTVEAPEEKSITVETTDVYVGRYALIPMDSYSYGIGVQRLVVKRLGGAVAGELCLSVWNDLDRDDNVSYTNMPLPGVGGAGYDEWVDLRAREIGREIYVNVGAYQEGGVGLGTGSPMEGGRATIRLDLGNFAGEGDINVSLDLQVPRGMGSTPIRLVFDPTGSCGEKGISLATEEGTAVNAKVLPSEISVFVDDDRG